jgi:hypothetical protein
MRKRPTRTLVTFLAIMTMAVFGLVVSSTDHAQAQPASPHHMVTATAPYHPPATAPAPHHHPETTPATQASPHVQYYCPMHPDVVQFEPGKCPHCGMTLIAAANPPGHPEHPAAHAETMPSNPHHDMH